MRQAILILILTAITFALANTNFRITHGKKAKEGEFPYHVYLLMKKPYPSKCGASLLNEYYVITAAHCATFKDATPVPPDSIKAIMGTVDLTDESIILHNVSEVIIHEKFSYQPFVVNDIAILKLAEKVQFSALVQPVVLPNHRGQIKEGKEIILTGFGWTEDGDTTDELLYAPEKVTNFQQCQDEYSINEIEPFKVTEDMFCANGLKPEQGGCFGDSGGPAVLKGTNILVGVIFWAYTPEYECSHELPDIYDSVMKYLDWIYDNTGIKPNH